MRLGVGLRRSAALVEVLAGLVRGECSDRREKKQERKVKLITREPKNEEKLWFKRENVFLIVGIAGVFLLFIVIISLSTRG